MDITMEYQFHQYGIYDGITCQVESNFQIQIKSLLEAKTYSEVI